MAKELNTEIVIQASPEKVWAILTDFDKYPDWNPFIKSIKGPAKVGRKITVRINPPEAKGLTFTPEVLAFEKNKEFRWQGHLFIPGLFDGEHKFELIQNGSGGTTFKHSETFKGILIPLFKKQLDYNTRKGFEQMNQKLKELAEQP
jgi:hypothetical protein